MFVNKVLNDSSNISGSKENLTIIDSSTLQFLLQNARQNCLQSCEQSVILDRSVLRELSIQRQSLNAQEQGSDSVAPVYEEFDKQNHSIRESQVNGLEPVILDDCVNENECTNPRKKLKLDDNIQQPIVDNACKKLDQNYIYQILKGCGEGEFLLEAYKYQLNNLETLLQEKKITYFKPSKVAKIIIQHEFYVTESFTISCERFEKLAADCIEVFPTHIEETFYYGPKVNKAAGGALYSAYIKIREKNIAIGRIKSEKVINVEIKKSNLPWLQELALNVDSIDKAYVEKWTSTSLVERTLWYKKSNLSEIFDKLPNLVKFDGYRLLQADFEATFTFATHTSEQFKNNLKALSPFIIEFAKSKADAPTKSRVLREQYKREVEGLILLLSKNTVVQAASEHESTLALMVLPYIFKRSTKIFAKKDKSSWNPTYDEISKSFIYHIEESDDENQSLSDVRATLLDIYNTHTLPLNGYIVVFGTSISRISSTYVIIGKTTYKVKGVVNAVNICFQALYILSKEFNRACNHVWLYIEKKLFSTNTKTSFANVSTVIEEIKKLEEASKVVSKT